MEELDDIIMNGLDAADSISVIIKQAIDASTTHEKDKLIKELKRVWTIQQNAMDAVNNSNKKKQEILYKLQEKEASKTKEYDTFYTNTSFLHQLERSNPMSKAEIAEEIKKIEKDISPIKPLSSPNALNEVMELPPEKDIYNLKTRDLLFSRLEELTYALKKRILVVEDSTNASIAVIDSFGTVSGLINAHNELLEENKILKEEESKYLNDAMAKRRNLTTIAPALLTNISVAMQSQLDALRTYGKDLSVPMEIDDNFPPLDSLCQVPDSLSFTRSDFGTNIDQELVDAIETVKTPEEKLKLLRSIMMVQYNSIQKLLNELEPLRKTSYCTNPESVERLERLWAMNDKFSAQILELATNIEKINDEVKDLNMSILRSIKQRRYIDEQFCSILKMMLPLIDETKALSAVTSKNRTIMNNVSKMCYNFALALLNTTSDNYNLTKDLILSRIPPQQPVIKVVEPPPVVEETPDEEKPHTDDPRKFFMLKPTTLKKPSKPRRQMTPAEIQETPKRTIVELPNPIKDAPRVQLLDYIALAHDITMSVERSEPLFHPTISGSLHDCLSQLANDVKDCTEDNRREMSEKIAKIQRGEAILRVPKVDIETTIETCPRTEIETMTEEPEPPAKKGKGKPEKGKKSAR